ncbi:hypothetical protein BJY04DRAFT_38441 [Aspergillus karnatakaensis]|uniref:translation initiation factor eIF-2B subunit family protein n=1 Tax=Aspergillus karnatakaensis TaxID=1810916 RepID=UPI003CCDAB6D
MAGQLSKLERRSVVSSFIFQIPNDSTDEPLVGLFKRSNKVSTYKQLIAPISGSISRADPDPLTAAWRELSEETTLNPSKLTLWRTGKPFSFADQSVGREWTIHPFAFRLRDGVKEDAIKTDWEHEGWKWYDPTAVLQDKGLEQTGVPHLRESLRRVWFEGELNGTAGRALGEGLTRILNDHESGSHELTSIALGVFREFIVNTQEGMQDAKWWEDVKMAAWHLVKNGRESMGVATLNVLLAALEEMDEIWRLDELPEEKVKRMLTIVDHHLKARTSRSGLVKETFASYVRSTFASSGQPRKQLTILTLSNSSTIRDSIVEAFTSLDIATLEMRILESRPRFEGVDFAYSLKSRFQAHFKDNSEKTLRITIYTDSSAALAAKGVDLVLLGADRISRSKGVSNKTGSLPAVLGAKHHTPDAKVVVLGELEKVNGETGIIDDEKTEDNDPEEVIRTWRNEGVKGVDVTLAQEEFNSTIEVKNIYFEWVPLVFVDAFVSGQGILDDAHIHQKANQQEELASRYFNSFSIRY